MSLTSDVLRLKEIVKAEQAEGEERLFQMGISVKSGTIEEVIDKIPNGSAFTSMLISESCPPLNNTLTTL